MATRGGVVGLRATRVALVARSCSAAPRGYDGQLLPCAGFVFRELMFPLRFFNTSQLYIAVLILLRKQNSNAKVSTVVSFCVINLIKLMKNTELIRFVMS